MREWQQEWLLSSILGSPAAPSDFGGELPGQSVCPGGRLVPVTETLPDFAARGISGHLLGDIGSEPSQHEVDHAHLQGSCTRGRQPLIVLAIPPISSQPSEGALDHPAPMSQDEPLCPDRSLHPYG